MPCRRQDVWYLPLARGPDLGQKLNVMKHSLVLPLVINVASVSKLGERSKVPRILVGQKERRGGPDIDVENSTSGNGGCIDHHITFRHVAFSARFLLLSFAILVRKGRFIVHSTNCAFSTRLVSLPKYLVC